MDEGTASGRRRRRGPIELVGLLALACSARDHGAARTRRRRGAPAAGRAEQHLVGGELPGERHQLHADAGRQTWLLLPAAWADGAGWANPGSYRTITSGDVDGDGNGELLGRSSSTIEVYTGPGPPGPGDSHLRAQPRAGAVDEGDPRLGLPRGLRRPDRLVGSVVLTAPSSSGASRAAPERPGRRWTWCTAPRIGPRGPHLELLELLVERPDHPEPERRRAGVERRQRDGRSYPQRYLTITTGDVTGDQTDEIIGVGPSGTVEVWGYDGSGLRRLDSGTGPLGPRRLGPRDPGRQHLPDGATRGHRRRGGRRARRRDPNLGLRAFSFTGGAWTELPGQGTNNWNDTEGWGNEVAYENITTGDLDGNGAQDLVGRSGQGAEAWTWNGTAWTQMAPRNNYNYDEGFYDQYPQYWATFQVGSVLEPGMGDPLLPGSEQILIKGGSGVGAQYLVADPDGPYPYQWQGSAANAYAFADGYGWQPPGTPVDDQGLDPDGTDDLYDGTIDEMVEAGQPQVVIGRNISGILDHLDVRGPQRGSGRAPQRPLALRSLRGYSDLSAVGNVVKPPQGTNVDLSVLSVEGRSYWGFNNAIAIDNWSQQVETWTLLDQFSTAGRVPCRTPRTCCCTTRRRPTPTAPARRWSRPLRSSRTGATRRSTSTGDTRVPGGQRPGELDPDGRQPPQRHLRRERPQAVRARHLRGQCRLDQRHRPGVRVERGVPHGALHLLWGIIGGLLPGGGRCSSSRSCRPPRGPSSRSTRPSSGRAWPPS